MALLRLLVFVMLGAVCVTAQTQRYSFKSYGRDQGLTNMDLTAMLQDRAGFIWVATQNGLFWYDGNSFREFESMQESPSRDVQALHGSPDGTLWVGTGSGLVRRRRRHVEHIELGVTVEIVLTGCVSVEQAAQ